MIELYVIHYHLEIQAGERDIYNTYHRIFLYIYISVMCVHYIIEYFTHIIYRHIRMCIYNTCNFQFCELGIFTKTLETLLFLIH